MLLPCGSSSSENYIGSAGPLDLGWQEKLYELAGADPADATRRLDQCIEQAGITVGPQQLQSLQPERAGKYDGYN